MKEQRINPEEQLATLTDTVNGLKAAVTELLSVQYSPAQALLKMDSYLIDNTAEAIRKREEEEKAQLAREALSNARKDFNDKVKANYWPLSYMTNQKRKESVQGIWDELKSTYQLPSDSEQPPYNHVQPDFDALLKRRMEVQTVVDTTNLTQAENTISFSENAIKDYKTSMESSTEAYVRKLNQRTEIPDSDKRRLIAEAKAECSQKVRREESMNNRQISSAKASFAQVENAKAELGKLISLIRKTI